MTVLRGRGLLVHAHDLYAEGFDPLLRPEEAWTTGRSVENVVAATDDPLLRQHREHLRDASALVVVHPNWWGKPPAILAGWIDRVLVPGVAYRLPDAGGVPEPLVALRELLVVNTSDTPQPRESEVFGDPLDLVYRHCLPPYLGEPTVRRLTLSVVSQADEPQRLRWLREVGEEAARLIMS